MLPIQKTALIAVRFARQECAELADMVVGGSSHLLRFMEHIGYRMPQGRVFSKPNIVDLGEVPVTDLRPPRSAGDSASLQIPRNHHRQSSVVAKSIHGPRTRK